MAAISRFGHVELADLPGDLAQRLTPIVEKSGFLPNIFAALGRRPRELRAFLDYHDALMDSDEGLSRAERELIVVATSAVNNCTYCVVAHGAILRIRARDPQLADRVAANPYTVALSARQRVIVDLALTVASGSDLLTEVDIDAAREGGLSEDEIWDVGAITALFAMSNRLAHFAAIDPNPEFFLLGRVPR
ncbi:MAG: peroxidase-related enzyme [Sporichthyaceae bacterium]